MKDLSSITRFLFDNHGVRGEILRLTEPCAQMLKGQNYPKCVRNMMSELAASAVLFAATLKDGSEVMVQIRGGQDSPIKYALVNIRGDLSFYGSAQLKENSPCPDDLSFDKLTGQGSVLVLTIFPADDPQNKWQGIVEVDPKSIAATLEGYFKNSQQLPTTFFIWSDDQNRSSAGIMLQVIPEIDGNQESLEHLSILASTMTEKEIMTLSPAECLGRLFAHEQVRVFPSKIPSFRCICSRERCEKALSSLAPSALESLINDHGTSMTCQHCGHTYIFSQKDLEDLRVKNNQ